MNSLHVVALSGARAALVVLLCLLAAGDAAGQGCPASDVVLLEVPPGTGSFPVDAAQFDSSLEESGVLLAAAAFDLVAGTVSVVHGEIHPGQTAVTVHDRFDVLGVDPGSPVELTVEFVVDGTVTTAGCGGSGCSAGIGASLEANGLRVEQSAGGIQLAPGTVAYHLAPRLTFSLVAGAPVDLAVGLLGARAPGGDHRAAATGAYRFVDLPPGLGIVSCRGFAPTPTPARAATWGRVKAAYHR